MQRIVSLLSAVAMVGLPVALAGAAGSPLEVDDAPPQICWQSIEPAALPGWDDGAAAFAGLSSWVATAEGRQFRRLGSAELEVRSATPQVFLFAPARVELGPGRTLDKGRALWVTARDAGVGVHGIVVRAVGGEAPGGLSGTLEIESTDLEGHVARVSLPSREPVSEPSPGRFCTLPRQVVVPDVVALGPARASALLEERQLALEIVGEMLDSPAGAVPRIVDQAPAAGEKAFPGSVVRSSVGGFSRVPPVVGSDVEDARQELTQLGLELRESGPRGVFPGAVAYRVLAQDPQAGTELAVGKAVEIDAGAFLRVPDLSGMELGRAGRELRTTGLRLESDAASPISPGGLLRVLTQTPSPGSLAVEGSPVRVEVVRLVRVPDVVGLHPAAARQALARRRLEPTGDESLAEYAAGALFELVEQAPPGGVEVAPGSSVAVRFEVLVPVPELRGRTFAGAWSLLAANGLRLGTTRWRAGSTFGIMIVTQGYPAGSRVPPGTAIDVALPQPYELAEISWPWPWVVVVTLLGAGLGWRRLRRPKAKMKVEADADLAALRQSAHSDDQAARRIALDVRLRPAFDAGVQTLSIDAKE